MDRFELVVPLEKQGQRLDIFLASHPKIPSRNFAQHLITHGLVKIDGKVVHKHHKIQGGEKIEVLIPPPTELELVPEEIPLKIIYEDDDLIVVSKPTGMVVHPSMGHDKGTLVHALLARSPLLSQIGGKLRPGIVHRLDRGTSGLMVIAKNDKSHQILSHQLQERKLKRRYLALVYGIVKEDQGYIDVPIGRSFRQRTKMAVAGHASREAVSHFKVLERLDNFSLLEVSLETGRTHQIRVHMAYIKHPVVGDPEYGGSKVGKDLGLERQFLHAAGLTLVHPRTGEELSFEDPLPEDLKRVLEKLRSESEGNSGRPGI